MWMLQRENEIFASALTRRSPHPLNLAKQLERDFSDLSQRTQSLNVRWPAS